MCEIASKHVCWCPVRCVSVCMCTYTCVFKAQTNTHLDYRLILLKLLCLSFEWLNFHIAFFPKLATMAPFHKLTPNNQMYVIKNISVHKTHTIDRLNQARPALKVIPLPSTMVVPYLMIKVHVPCVASAEIWQTSWLEQTPEPSSTSFPTTQHDQK